MLQRLAKTLVRDSLRIKQSTETIELSRNPLIENSEIVERALIA